MAPTEILHLTPHLGGGVGKALSSLSLQAIRSGSEMHHSIVCHEPPTKSVFLQRILDAGGRVHVAPGHEVMADLIEAADVVHLDWWNHPAIFRALCSRQLPPMRLLVWCHVSGLFAPFIPAGLLEAAQRFVFTSTCSLQAENVKGSAPRLADKLAVVSSGCGMEDFPALAPRTTSPGLRAGYVGSLNFAKLHPQYVDYLAEVDLPDFHVDLIGDTLNRQALEARCAEHGKPNMLYFRGFTLDIAAALAGLDVLIYLLNPEHYGTAENALIEAMAMGVVPIVLDNPAERQIVRDGVTGHVVRTPTELAQIVSRLAADPEARLAIGREAACTARKLYTSARMAVGLAEVYEAMRSMPKETIDFASIFGATPADWFLACQGADSPFRPDGSLNLGGQAPASMLMERSKGSVFHFRDHFPEDERLKAWANELVAAQ